MGPPPFGDGNLSWPRFALLIHPSASMGPPPFGDGNVHSSPATGVGMLVLQWGHRLSAMETTQAELDAHEASTQLQWGHRLSAMETRRNP